MANHKSAKKRSIQSNCKNSVNTQYLTKIRSTLNKFNNSVKNLRNSMGLIGKDISINLPKKVEINLIIPSFEEAFQLMSQNSPSLNILDRRVDSAKISVKQSWASSLPSLSMNVGYNATSGDQITKQYFEDNYIKSANLTLSIPIFNGFRKRNDVKISKLQLSKQKSS